MNKIPLPTPEQVRQLLRYEPETGKLFWLPRPRELFATQRAFSAWNAQNAGNEAFTSRHNFGYRTGAIFARQMMAHRVIWAVVYGEWPTKEIDHRNGKPDDNRLANLRLATSSQNKMNRVGRAKTKAGMRGVSYSSRSGRWFARITAGGVTKALGTFETRDEAKAAYDAAAHRYHGDFHHL